MSLQLSRDRVHFHDCESAFPKLFGANCEIRFAEVEGDARGLILEILDLATRETFITTVVRFSAQESRCMPCDAQKRRHSERNGLLLSEFNCADEHFPRVEFRTRRAGSHRRIRSAAYRFRRSKRKHSRDFAGRIGGRNDVREGDAGIVDPTSEDQIEKSPCPKSAWPAERD
jgi:hypothetical protein